MYRICLIALYSNLLFHGIILLKKLLFSQNTVTLSCHGLHLFSLEKIYEYKYIYTLTYIWHVILNTHIYLLKSHIGSQIILNTILVLSFYCAIINVKYEFALGKNVT